MKRITFLTLALCALLTACALGSPERAEQKSRLPVAEAMFAERCKKGGEFIHRTADNVEGIFLLKLRPEDINYGDQYRMDDPYGRDYRGEAYIKSFLRGFDAAEPSGIDANRSLPKGYRYVEATDPKDGKRYRYTGVRKVVGRKDVTAPNVQLELKRNPKYDLNNYAFALERSPATNPMPRYGVTYDDISTRDERDYWIAGSSLKVIDLQTNEVMAERIGYMMDRGQGDISGGRAPWLLAANNSCPLFARNHGASAQPGQARLFASSILKPLAE